MERSEKLILVTTVASHGLTHVAELTFPATAILVAQEFFGQGREYTEIGLAASISAFLFGLAALPSGWLVDRLGARRVLLLFLFGSGLSLAGLSFMPDFRSFTVALACLGFFSGLYHPAGATLISNGIREHGQAMGAHGMGGNLGLAITPFLAAALARTLGGWRYAYAVLGVFPLLMGLLILTRALQVGDSRPTHDSESEPDAKDSGPAFQAAPLILLFLMVGFNGMAYRGLMTFLPAYFAEKVTLDWSMLAWLSAKGASAADVKVTVAGALTTLILLLGVVGQYVGGRLADKVRKEKLYTVIFFLTAPILASLALFEGLTLVAVTGLFAFLYFMNQPVGNATIPRYTAPRVRGLVFGLFFFMGFGVGSIMSYVSGVIGERFELSYIFFIFGGCLLTSALLGLVLIRKTANLD
jgi:MFS family permease